jgi:methionyl-tRNA synthetase
MIVRYRDGIIPEGRAELAPVDAAVRERFDELDLTGALEVIWGMVRAANRYVEERQPWVLARSDAAADQALLDTTLYTLADAVRSLGVLLHPFMPASSARMLEAVGDPGAVAWERAGVGLLPAGIGVVQPPPLFPRA